MSSSASSVESSMKSDVCLVGDWSLGGDVLGTGGYLLEASVACSPPCVVV